MASPGLTIPTSFTATGNYWQQVNKMASATDRFAAGLARLNAIGKGSELTKNLLGYVKAGALISGAFATARFSSEAIMGYETAIQSLQAVTGVTNTEMITFKKEIADLGVTSKKSMTNIAGGLEIVGSAMSQYLEDPKALRQITEAGIVLSKAARMDLEPALEGLTSIMNQFGLAADKSLDSVNRLSAGEIVGSVRAKEVTEHLKAFGGVAANMNVDISESIALVEVLGLKLKSEKIGVGARNILSRISASGGLDKRARMDLRRAGVDTRFLMDSTKSLSERLHELGKIAKDPIKMMSIFNDENIAAASAIFQNLDKYDMFVDRIKKTNLAEQQAAINSKTLAVALDQLKNKFSNLLNTNSTVSSGLNKVRDSLFYVADHMEGIVSVITKVVGGFLLWKGVLIATTAALSAYNAISNVVFLVDMVKRVAAIKNVTTATAALAVVQKSLNATMLLNPAFLVAAGLTVLVGATILAVNQSQKLREEYQKNIDLRVGEETDKVTASIKKQALEYYNLGQNIQKATENSIKAHAVKIAMDRSFAETYAQENKKKLDAENEKYYSGDLFAALIGYKMMYGKRAEYAEKYAKYETEASSLASQQAALVAFAKQEQLAGVIGGMSLSKYIQPFNNNTEPAKMPGYGDMSDIFSEQRKNYISKEKTQSDFEKARLEVIVKNQTEFDIDVKSGKTQLKSAKPNTNSSFSIK